MKVFIACLVAVWLLSSGAVLAQEVTDHSAAAQERINAVRKAAKQAPIGVSAPLTRAAAAHTADMATKGFFGHTGSDGSSVGRRVKRQGYRFCFVAENIAKGQKNLAAVMQSWMSSDGHRRNLLSGDVTQYGLVRGPGNLWVMVLARPGC